MDDLNCLSRTPTKMIKTDTFQLPDTPTSLASSYNQDVIYPLRSPKNRKTLNLDASDNANESANYMVECTNKIKYNPIDDSIESFVSDRISSTQHNKSILVDFQDINAMIENKKIEYQHHDNDADLIQKWLEDRKRWDIIQRKYEQKLIETQNKFENKTLYFQTKELRYQQEIKNLNQQIESFQSKQNKQFIKLDEDYQTLNTKCQDLQQSFNEKDNQIQHLKEKLNEKDLIINKLETENKNIQENINNLLKKLEHSKIGNEEISEYKQENERLKHLELTSQNMVERLLKRLEQQIHSSEKIQKQLNLKEEEHEKEIMKLEEINAKLQKHLTVFNPSKPSPLSASSSQSSLFTLSTIMTTEKHHHEYQYKDLDSLQKENKFREIINIDKDNEFAKQSILIDRLKAEINEYKHSTNQCEIIINDEKDTINNLQITINEQRNSISILEKSNSDISSALIEQRALRQQLEKQVEDLQFENKQLRNKLIVFKNNILCMEQSTDDEIFEYCVRPASANNASMNKDKLLLDSLRQLIHKYSNNPSHSAPNINISPPTKNKNININNVHAIKKNKKQYRFTTPKNTLVHKGNFIHKTTNNYNKSKKQPRPRHRISSMTPVSYLHDTNNNNTARNISMKRKRNINHRRVSAYVTTNNIKKTKRKSNKSKIVKIPQTCKSKALISKSKRRKKVSSQSVSKRHVLKPCIHKRL